MPCRSLGVGAVHCLQGCHSSDWEQRWLQHADTLQQGACTAMKQDADLSRSWVQQVTERECWVLSGLHSCAAGDRPGLFGLVRAVQQVTGQACWALSGLCSR